MRTAAEIRRENLRYILDSQFQGIVGRMARRVGKQYMQIARIFDSNEAARKNCGDKVARDIEASLGLEKGWLDQDHAKSDDLVRQIEVLDTEGRLVIESMIALLVRRKLDRE